MIDDKSLPVFQQRWFLDIAKGSAGRYCEAEVADKGDVIARLPYVYFRKNRLFKMAEPVPWSRLSGPILYDGLQVEEKYHAVCRLIAQLPPRTSLRFIAAPDNNCDVIKRAFLDTGFLAVPQLTLSERPDDPDIMARMSSKNRSHLRTAAKQLEVFSISPDEFVAFYQSNLESIGDTSGYPLKIARDLLKAGISAPVPQVRIFAARQKNPDATSNKDIPLDAAIACAWDKNRYYNWLVTYRRGTPDNLAPHQHASKLLTIEATRHARELGLVYDIDGAGTVGRVQRYQIFKFPHEETRVIFRRVTATVNALRATVGTLRNTVKRMTLSIMASGLLPFAMSAGEVW